VSAHLQNTTYIETPFLLCQGLKLGIYQVLDTITGITRVG